METDGIKGVGRRKLSAHLVGMTVEFVTDLESSGFIFDNPMRGTNAPAVGPSASRHHDKDRGHAV